jgi:hypothetical protein
MLKRVIALLLIVTMVGANFSRFFIYAGFELNKKYIIANLCENRNRPWLHCNGRCYFMKKIKQAEQKEKSTENEAQKNLYQEAFYTKPAVIKFHTQLLQVIPVPNNRVALPQVYIPVFQPPQLG